jgi:AbiV family abortive infection protein
MRKALGSAPETAFETLREWNGALITNATDLLSEADLLCDEMKYARALALAHFAMEEMGKVVSLMSLAVEIALGNEPDWTTAEKVWSSHDLKFELFHFIDVMSQVPTASALSSDLGLLQELEMRLAGRPLREMALYVDVEEGVAQVPSSRFTEDLAKLYLGTAFHAGKMLIEVMAKSGDRLQEVVERLSDPASREKLDRAKAEFTQRFAAARLAARKEVMRELRALETK